MGWHFTAVADEINEGWNNSGGDRGSSRRNGIINQILGSVGGSNANVGGGRGQRSRRGEIAMGREDEGAGGNDASSPREFFGLRRTALTVDVE